MVPTDLLTGWSGASRTAVKILAIAAVAIGAHVGVLLVRRAARRLSGTGGGRSQRKVRSLVSLASSVLIFTLYFGAVGLILHQLGLSLTAYLASASVIGLAVAFGSQGLIQDVVTGLTLVFSDLFDVGDMVEIGGQTGVVQSIGMRFTVLANALGALVYIPNRSISGVINYPRGYLRCVVDVVLPADEALSDAIAQRAQATMTAATEQFPGIAIAPPSIEGRFTTSTGKHYLRIKFRIWPGRGGPLETTFRQELQELVKQLVPQLEDWMISVYYEVEKPTPPKTDGPTLPRIRLSRPKL